MITVFALQKVVIMLLNKCETNCLPYCLCCIIKCANPLNPPSPYVTWQRRFIKRRFFRYKKTSSQIAGFFQLIAILLNN